MATGVIAAVKHAANVCTETSLGTTGAGLTRQAHDHSITPKPLLHSCILHCMRVNQIMLVIAALISRSTRPA